MSRGSRIALGVLVAAVGIGGALACGPFFPWQLLDDREATVAAPIGLSFAYEASRLVPGRSDGMRVVERADVHEESEAIEAEQNELLQNNGNRPGAIERMAALKAARAAPTADEALQAAAILPAAVGEYIAGAIEFKAGRWETAIQHFAAIDRLPPEEQRSRTVAAAYMRGRLGQRTGDFDAARAALRETRDRARRNPDPMGLGVASLGEEARVDLVDAGLIANPWTKSGPTSVGEPRKAAELVVRAIRLYAEQAVRGSKMALLSLDEVAKRLVGKPDLLERVVADPVARRLVVASVASRSDVGGEENDPPDAEAARVVVDAVLARQGDGSGEDFERVAAIAYQAGRYQDAERLVAATAGPLGLWVRAKLALRRGDKDAALRDLLAAAAMPSETLDDWSRRRLQGELAVVHLGRGDYRDSLEALLPVARAFWGDAAYIAERVLTVDELKALVDGLPAEDDTVDGTSESLRALLARRLMREGRRAEAIPYFPSSADRGSMERPERSRALRTEARSYLLALDAARSASAWQGVSRAQALFAAATLARARGMELMGTEGPPDVAALEGIYPGGIGQARPQGEERTALLGPDELARFAASAPKPDVRFHYRQIAVDHALAAADLLPQGSQAYAATLCWASRFAFALRSEAGDKLAADIYRRYVKTGAYQSWATRFGRVCPEPDFEAARDYWPRRITGWTAAMAGKARRHLALSIAAVLLATALGGFAVARARAKSGNRQH